MVRDHSTLGQLVETMRPGLIFAEDGVAFEAALSDVAGGIEVVTSTPPRNRSVSCSSAVSVIQPSMQSSVESPKSG